MANGDLIKLGTVYVGETTDIIRLRPSKPWTGENKDFGYGNLEPSHNFRIKDTHPDEMYQIYWREVNIGSTKLYIADRNLLNVKLGELIESGWVYGKIITIDGKKYKIRLLTGGSTFDKNATCAEPANNEWDQIICNRGNFPNLPTPASTDLDPSSSKLNSYHNKYWNWISSYSWIQERPVDTKSANVRGWWEPNYFTAQPSSSTCGWRPVLEVLNEPPTISDVDKNLGDKNTAFSISYQLNDADNDALTVIEKLNGNILRTLNNAPKGQNLVINITNERLYSLPLNVENKISIEVNDGKGGVSYRNYTFKRTNSTPIISNTDKNLGIITALTEKYTINDIEGNAVNVIEKLNNITLRSFAALLGKEYTTTIDKDTWIKLKNGQHTYSIEAMDSNNSKSTRVFSFTKKENKIDFTLAKPFSTDIKASKILVTPSWELNGATAKVEVCNNGFDVNPTWEDITKQVLINRHYNFTNTAKTADKWGVNIRIYIEKDQASLAEVSIKGFGGAFE